MKKEFTCKFCQRKFIKNYFPSKPQPIYCSNKCYHNKRHHKPFRCLICGKTTKGKRNRFCSISCSNKMRKHNHFINKKCQQCGKNFTTYKRKDSKERKYCSRKCANQYLSSIFTINPRIIVCIVCQRTFQEKYGSNNKRLYTKYCSRECANKILSEKVKGNKNPFFRRYNNDPVFRERILSGKAKANKQNGTKPELKCKQILENLGVSFEYQFLIKPKFIVDFCIDKIIIQVDGEYWHGHPRFEPLTPRQITQKKRDIAQDKYLTKCGYTIYRIWESELSEIRIKAILSMAI